MTIYGSSKHPVLIKKINVNIWSLRDEIEFTLQKRLDYCKANGIAFTLEDIKKEYSLDGQPTGPIPDDKIHEPITETQPLKVVPPPEKPKEATPEIEGTEDEMLKAMQESTESPSEENIANVMMTAINEFSSEGMFVRQRHPVLPKSMLVKGRTVLAEIYMDKMLLFTNKKFIDGQSIVIEFDITKKFLLNATVGFCKEHNLKNRIISETPFIYRMGVKFTFLKKGERTLLRQFLSAIQPDINRPELESIHLEQKEESLDEVLDGLDL